MKTLGERLKYLRGDVKQDDFAAIIGINKNTLRAYEKDRNSPTADTILSIANKLLVSESWLAFGIGQMKRGKVEETNEIASQLELHEAMSHGSEWEKIETLKRDLSNERDLNRELNTENRELNKENRQLWKENADLRVEVERLKVKAESSQTIPNETQRKAS